MAMKKIIPSALILALVMFIIPGCDQKNGDDPIVAPQGMNILDLTNYGKPFVLFIPDTTAAKLSVKENPNGALEIRVGNNFGVAINEQAGDVETKKKEIKDDEVFKFNTFLKEEPNAILWRADFMDKAVFHFMVNMKIGTSDYCFEDIISTETEPFRQEDAQKMFDSAKSIKEKNKEQPAS